MGVICTDVQGEGHWMLTGFASIISSRDMFMVQMASFRGRQLEENCSTGLHAQLWLDAESKLGITARVPARRACRSCLAWASCINGRQTLPAEEA